QAVHRDAPLRRAAILVNRELDRRAAHLTAFPFSAEGGLSPELAEPGRGGAVVRRQRSTVMSDNKDPHEKQPGEKDAG
ncbi:hypothetical protein ABTJ92_22940, partial [Acinetobacter baumannii]